jgi:Fe2+ transport system protein FeoA
MEDQKTLAGLEPGETGTIVRIRSSSPFKKRLMEMGMVKGEIIQKVKLAPLADPAEYVIKGYHVSLRNEEAKDVILM